MEGPRRTQARQQPHELTHFRQREALIPERGYFNHKRSPVFSSPLYQRVSRRLRYVFGCSDDPAELISEILADGLSGAYRRLGLTEDESVDLVLEIFRETAGQHGKEAYNPFRNAKPTIRREIERRWAARDNRIRAAAGGRGAEKDDRGSKERRPEGIRSGP